MDRTTAAALALGTIGALSGAANAQCPDYWYQILATEGEVVPEVGAITGFGKSAVNTLGEWRVEAYTDHPDPAASTVVLGRGLLLRQGRTLAEPPGATLAGFDDLDLYPTGAARIGNGWIFRLGTGSAADDAGLYLNDTLVIQKGDVSSAPEFAPGTAYAELLYLRFNRPYEVLLMADMEEPGAGALRAIVRVQHDPATGEVVEQALHKSGDLLPGQVERIEAFPATRSAYARHFRDDIAFIADLAGPPERDSVLYLGDTLLAQEGDESLIAGRRWQVFEAVIAEEAAGVRARLDGDPASDTVIAAWPIGTPGPGKILAQKGGAVPGVPGAAFTGFGSAPLGPAPEYGVYWYGAWPGGAGLFEGRLFDDPRPVIVAGETVIDGRLVTDVAGGERAFAAFYNFIVAQVTLDGGVSAVVLVRKSGETCCYSDFDCNGYLDFFDFLEFQTEFAMQTPRADCDGSGTYNFFDFLCFQDSFYGGCCP